MKQRHEKKCSRCFSFLRLRAVSFSWSENRGGIAIRSRALNARVGRPAYSRQRGRGRARQYRRAAIGTRPLCAGGGLYGGCGYYAGSPTTVSNKVPGAPQHLSGWLRRKRPGSRPSYAVSAYYTGGPWYGYSGGRLAPETQSSARRYPVK